MKNIQIYHHTKIDVVKFDGTNNFDLWRCEVLDAQFGLCSRIAREAGRDGGEDLKKNEKNNL